MSTLASANRAFTLMELMVVMAVMILLAGLGLPAFAYMKKQGEVRGTTAVINAVAAAISSYQLNTWTYTNALGKQRVQYLWAMKTGPDSRDKNGSATGFYTIDGMPAVLSNATHDSPFDQGLVDSGYTGFYLMTQTSIPKRFVNKQRQVTDAWGQPLRIAFAANTYGASWCGIWSPGLDGTDNLANGSGNVDDICSWKNSVTEQ